MILRLAGKTLPSLALMVLSAAALAGHPAHDLLMKMHHASRNLNYEGIFVYEHDDQLEAMRIIHLVENGKVAERLLSLNGAAREIVRNDREVRCYLPDESAVVVEHRKATDRTFPDIFTQNLEGLDRNYVIGVGEAGRVAGRPTQSVIIRPKDHYRYGYRLWADENTGLLLKVDLLDAGNKTIEQIMFTEVTISDGIDPSRVEAQTDATGLVWHRENEVRQPADPGMTWHASELPSGFTLSLRLWRNVPTRKIPVDHLVYTDGLAAVSVFVERTGRKAPAGMVGPSHMGAVHAFGRIVDDHHVTAVGEVPAATVKLIGNSVTLK